MCLFVFLPQLKVKIKKKKNKMRYHFTSMKMNFLFVLIWLCHAACVILVPRQGIKPIPPMVEAWSLNHWTTRTSLNVLFCFNKFIYLFIYWLCWVFAAVHRLSLVAASGCYSSLQCVGFSLSWLLLLRSMGSRCTGFSSCGTWAQ